MGGCRCSKNKRNSSAKNTMSLQQRTTFLDLVNKGASASAFKKLLGLDLSGIKKNIEMIDIHIEYVRLRSEVITLREKMYNVDNKEEKNQIMDRIGEIKKEFRALKKREDLYVNKKV